VVVVRFDVIGVVASPPAVVPRYTLYEVEPFEADQVSDTEALPAVAVSPVGAEGALLEPEELELLLDELDEDELLDDEEEDELDEEDEPVPLELPPPDELEDEELEEELDELFFGVAEASLDSTLVPTLFTAATL